MEDNLEGRLVYLTVHSDVWFRELNSMFNIPMANRLAKVIKVFNWDSDEGKLLLKERRKTGKWTTESALEFKYVLKIYYPELKKGKNKEVGLQIEEVMPMYYPGTSKTTKLNLFEVLPSWMVNSLIKENKYFFKIEKVKPKTVKENVS